jgi:hypothetical protein
MRTRGQDHKLSVDANALVQPEALQYEKLAEITDENTSWSYHKI